MMKRRAKTHHVTSSRLAVPVGDASLQRSGFRAMIVERVESDGRKWQRFVDWTQRIGLTMFGIQSFGNASDTYFRCIGPNDALRQLFSSRCVAVTFDCPTRVVNASGSGEVPRRSQRVDPPTFLTERHATGHDCSTVGIKTVRV